MLSNAAAVEIHQLQSQCQEILAKRNISQSDRKRADLLLAKIKGVRANRLSTDEMNQKLLSGYGEKLGVKIDEDPEATLERRCFKAFLSGRPEAEIRGMLAGAQTISWTEGASGGYLVPADFGKKVWEAMAWYDPLFYPELVDLDVEDDFSLQPQIMPGWDLSSFTAAKISETVQQTEQTAPDASQMMAGSHTYRASLGGSFEWEMDSAAYGTALAAMARALGVGMARGIGADLATGNGSTAPQGVLTGAVDSGVTLDPTITANVSATANAAFQDAYFSLNRVYRKAQKSAWLMNDSTYRWIRQLSDASTRPLLNIQDDFELLMGLPIAICPTIPTYGASPLVTGKIVLGDFSYFHVHASAMLLRRRTQVPGYVEYGRSLYTALQRVDAKVFDPTGGANSGANSPIKFITIQP